MSKRKTSRISEAASEIDVRLGDLLGHLGDALDEVVSRLGDAEDGGEIRRERMFDTGKGPIRASAGVRIRTLGGTAEAGSERQPHRPVNQRGNPSKTEDAPEMKPQPDASSNDTSSYSAGPVPRSVEATIFEDGGAWSLVADMPGISLADVRWQRVDDALRLEAQNERRHYTLETEWPAGLAETALDCSVTNGILELYVKDGAV